MSGSHGMKVTEVNVKGHMGRRSQGLMLRSHKTKVTDVNVKVTWDEGHRG